MVPRVHAVSGKRASQAAHVDPCLAQCLVNRWHCCTREFLGSVGSLLTLDGELGLGHCYHYLGRIQWRCICLQVVSIDVVLEVLFISRMSNIQSFNISYSLAAGALALYIVHRCIPRDKLSFPNITVDYFGVTFGGIALLLLSSLPTCVLLSSKLNGVFFF
jgi:hypothetical protein